MYCFIARNKRQYITVLTVIQRLLCWAVYRIKTLTSFSTNRLSLEEVGGDVGEVRQNASGFESGNGVSSIMQEWKLVSPTQPPPHPK